MNNLFLVKLKKNWKKVAIVMALLLSFVAMSLLFIPTKEVSPTSAATLPTDYWSSYQSSSYYDSGSGTEASPYLISTPGQLANLSAVYNAGSITSKKYFKLTENINLSKHLWVPIGTETHPFNGVIDGNDKAIAGLTQNTALVYAGLIGYAGEIEVKNLNLSGVNITNTSTTQGAVGALVGIINSSSYTAKFSNIVVTGRLETKTNYPSTKDSLGSLIGSILACKSGSIIENVSVNTSLKAENRSVNTTVNPLIGFIQSTNSNLTVRNSFAQSSIKIGETTTVYRKYEGNFGGSSTNALWTFDSRLNNGLPILKNNYWITAANSASYNKTGTQIVNQLGALGFSTGLLIKTTVYILTKSTPSNGSYTTTLGSDTDSNYGTISAVYGELITVNPTAGTGYSFSSISVSPTTTYPTTTSFIMPNSNATLTVNFTLNQYALTLTKGTGISRIYYKINGASSYSSTTSSTTVQVDYGSTWYAYATAATGYSYTAYTSTSPRSGTMGTSGASYAPSGTVKQYNLTLTKGTGISRIYYKVNGASSYSSTTSTTTIKVNYNSTWYAYATAATGYSYTEYTSTSPRSGTMGTSGASYAPTGTPNQYALTITKGTGISTIYYKVNGASSYTATTSDTTVQVDYNSTWYAYATAATNYYYQYNSESNPKSGKMTTSGATYAPSGTPVYYVKYNANGGSGSMDNSVHPIGTAKTLSANTFTRSGYVFDSWNTNSSGTGASYSNQESVTNLSTTLGATFNLYAQWTPIYTVSFSGNGSTSGSMSSQTIKKDEIKQLNSNAYSKSFTVTLNYNGSGTSDTTRTSTYSFSGWKSNTTGGLYGSSSPPTTTVTASSIIADGYYVKNLTSTIGGTVTLTAQWSGGSVSLPSASRTNYSFGGWYTSSSGGTRVGGANDSYTPTSNITLYARWLQPITVTFDYGVGSGSPSSAQLDPTKTYTNLYYTSITGNVVQMNGLPVPTQNYSGSKRFVGWKDSSGNKVKNSTTCVSSSNHTLTAVWVTLGGRSDITSSYNYYSDNSVYITPFTSTSNYSASNWSITVRVQTELELKSPYSGKASMKLIDSNGKVLYSTTVSSTKTSSNSNLYSVNAGSKTFELDANVTSLTIVWYNYSSA